MPRHVPATSPPLAVAMASTSSAVSSTRASCAAAVPLIVASSVRTFTGPKGSLLFCNTAGFHRGGFSTSDPRVLATVTYSSPASLASLTERSYRYTGQLDELDAPTRFALT